MAVVFEHYVESAALRTLIELARREDLGDRGVDVTSDLLIDPSAHAQAAIVAREPGVVCGLATLATVAEVYGHDLHITPSPAPGSGDGRRVAPGDAVATLRGPHRSLLTAERVALNLCTHLSGIATLTARFVDAVAGTGAAICDTRKTLPGLRGLQKYAVACGGGTTHRMGLHDAVLVKDNHVAAVPPEELSSWAAGIVAEARRRFDGLAFVMIEVDTLDQLRRVLPSACDIVLLDNMAPDALRQAVAMRDRVAPEVKLEASGGITLGTVRAVAESRVDRISVGALTHSARSLDLGLDMRAGGR
jgi:nicotinate-nucleotide pyrophosphorylase (carboxylating)